MFCGACVYISKEARGGHQIHWSWDAEPPNTGAGNQTLTSGTAASLLKSPLLPCSLITASTNCYFKRLPPSPAVQGGGLRFPLLLHQSAPSVPHVAIPGSCSDCGNEAIEGDSCSSPQANGAFFSPWFTSRPTAHLTRRHLHGCLRNDPLGYGL